MSEDIIVVKCSSCGYQFVFPQEDECPNCHQVLSVRDLKESIRLGNFDSDAILEEIRHPVDFTNPPEEEERRPMDVFPLAMTWAGLLLCALICIGTFFDGLFFRDFVFSVNAAVGPIYPVIRWVLFGLGIFGLLRGVASLLSWDSGRYFYRRFWPR